MSSKNKVFILLNFLVYVNIVMSPAFFPDLSFKKMKWSSPKTYPTSDVQLRVFLVQFDESCSFTMHSEDERHPSVTLAVLGDFGAWKRKNQSLRVMIDKEGSQSCFSISLIRGVGWAGGS